MRILHIDETFHPSFGYQCTPLAKFQCSQGNEVFVIAPEAQYIYPVYHSFGEYGEHLAEDDALYENTTGVKVVRVRAKGYIARRLNYIKEELFSSIERINPDVIMVHCLETITAIRVLFKYKNKFPIVFDSHMLAMATKNRLSGVLDTVMKLFVTPQIIKYKIPVIITQNDPYVNEHFGIPKNQTYFISFGTDTGLFCENTTVRERFIEENNLPTDSFIVVSTGKMSEIKGGMFFSETVKKKFSAKRNVVIVLVADFSGEYEKKVKNELKHSENIIVFYPVQKYLDLPWFYQIADICVFPNQCSMSFYDAQACGVPVVSEDNNINVDRNSHGNGICFKSKDVNSFRNAISEMANMDKDTMALMRANSKKFILENYSYDVIAKEYTSILEKQIRVFNKGKYN